MNFALVDEHIDRLERASVNVAQSDTLPDEIKKPLADWLKATANSVRETKPFGIDVKADNFARAFLGE